MANQNSMKIAVTGCTGFVGREVVPQLLASGADVLLVGRSLDKIQAIFPGVAVATYADLSTRAEGFDVLAHMASMNNNAVGTLDQFLQANVTLTLETLASARAAGICRVIHFSSFHALDETNNSSYARSKREAASALRARNIHATTLFLPAVYGRSWTGKLAILNRLPRWFGQKIFTVVSAFKPVVDVRKIGEFLLNETCLSDASEVFIYDDKDSNPVFRFLKRGLDLSFAIVTLLMFGWLLALLWLFVRIGSPGPGMFAQTRVGQFSRHFICYKLRTMVHGTRQSGTHEIGASSITSVGRFLRKSKLDELPQVWNILLNEMSLVGPRPCLPIQGELVEHRSAARVFDVKPGITGLAQIHDVDMSNPALLTAFDVRYKALRSVIFDVKILFATILGRGQGDRTSQ